MASSLSRTPSGAGNQRTWTYSGWFKLCTTDQNIFLLSAGAYGDSKSMQLLIANSGNFIQFQGFSSGGSADFNCETNAELRDIGAWYHIMVACDTTQSTASDRAKIYINGELQTLRTSTYPSQNYDTGVNTAIAHEINDRPGASLEQTLYSTHVHMTDGTAYAASTFGETDSTSGIWKPKTAPSVTYGTNGFFLKMENSGAMGTDSSGNSNTFTVNGTITQNVDTPTNVFATLNKLSTHGNNSLTNGNLTIGFNANTSYTNSIGTLGINSGRWYVEAKVAGATTYYPCIGFCSMGNNTRRYYDPLYTAAHLGADEGTGYFAHGNIQKGGSTDGDYATFTTGDIISMYLDLESGTKTMKYYKNDSLIRSTTITPVDGQFYTFGATGTSGSDIVNFNFGSGFFGTTAVASGNADANGFGSFEYSPTLSGVNYYALCTKNIKEFG